MACMRWNRAAPSKLGIHVAVLTCKDVEAVMKELALSSVPI